jgi:hypothetical protein
LFIENNFIELENINLILTIIIVGLQEILRLSPSTFGNGIRNLRLFIPSNERKKKKNDVEKKKGTNCGIQAVSEIN